MIYWFYFKIDFKNSPAVITGILLSLKSDWFLVIIISWSFSIAVKYWIASSKSRNSELRVKSVILSSSGRIFTRTLNFLRIILSSSSGFCPDSAPSELTEGVWLLLPGCAGGYSYWALSELVCEESFIITVSGSALLRGIRHEVSGKSILLFPLCGIWLRRARRSLPRKAGARFVTLFLNLWLNFWACRRMSFIFESQPQRAITICRKKLFAGSCC